MSKRPQLPPQPMAPQGSGIDRRRFLAGTGALLGAGALAGVLPGAARAQTPGLVIYSTTHPAIQANLNAAFTEKTGVEVMSMRLNSSGIAQRFMAEYRAGQHLCDILTLGNDIFLNELKDDGGIIDLSDSAWYGDLAPFWRPSTHFVRTNASPGGIAYNPRLIDAATSPRSWADLLRPEYRGNMVLTDPRVNDSFLTFPALLRHVMGDDYLAALGQQDLALVPVTSQGVEQVISGERAIVFPCNPGNLELYAGQGVIELNHVDTPYWTSYFGSIPTRAPHPEEARAYMDFLMSVEGQEILCKDVAVSPLANVPGAIPTPEGELIEVSIETALAERDDLFDLLNLPA